MSVLKTSDLTIPDQILAPWLGKVGAGSIISNLSAQTPMRFGRGSSMTFDIGEAEYVGEGENKGSSTVTKVVKTVKPFKFHKTIRWTDEVVWADADAQLGVLTQLLDLVQPSLSRALDYGVIHGINPTGGAPVAAMTEKLAAATSVVTIAAQKPYQILDAADVLVLGGGFVPKDIAVDSSWAGGFSTARGVQSEQRLYPNFTLSTDVSELEGHRAAVSRTVAAAGVAATDTKLKGIVGDFSAVRWGVQRTVPMELIQYGDPDGQGDLKRNNQVAFRMEIVYGWGIADLGAFALLKTA